jgi:hypothetical protein
VVNVDVDAIWFCQGEKTRYASWLNEYGVKGCGRVSAVERGCH